MFALSNLPMLHKLQETATRVRNMIHKRAVAEYHLAFGHVASETDHLDGCVMHNSLVGRETGSPWPEVNYDHMRRAAWLCEQSFKPDRLVQQWYMRKCKD